jgi:hypothetical protein
MLLASASGRYRGKEKQWRLRRGFRVLYPVLREGIRTMIDWARMGREKKTKMRVPNGTPCLRAEASR